MNDRDNDSTCFVCRQPHWEGGRLVSAIAEPSDHCAHRESSRTDWRMMKRRKSAVDYLTSDEFSPALIPIAPQRETRLGFMTSVTHNDAFRRRR